MSEPMLDPPRHINFRSPNLGNIEGIEARYSSEYSCDIFRRMCATRAFETIVKAQVEEGNITCLVYLSLGQESIAAGVSTAVKSINPWILGQHRSHSIYLSFGGTRIALIDELLGLPTGCCGGMGGSPPIHDFENRIIGHIGLIGDQVPVAAGVALSNPGEQVICFFGDGAAEEDYVLAALGFAASRNLNILFVCEDNDLSVLTPTSVRRNWQVTEVAKSFGLKSVEISDNPWLISHWTHQLLGQPALINVQTCRDTWHVGIGNDGPPNWDRFELTKESMDKLGLGNEARQIENVINRELKELWDQRLLIPSVN